MDLSPLIFKPLLLPKVWGGRHLSQWGKDLAPGAAIGESWELYDRPDKSALVAEGPWAGRSLSELCAEFGPRLLGPGLWKNPPEQFPLLVKLIDATQDLSVQVHPDNDQAAVMVGPHEQGKSEMWVVLAAEPGAKMSVGLKPGVDAKVFRKALAEGGVEALLRKFSVEAGDVIDIPAGCVHALGQGCLVAEVQQNSDTTFRVWDYERLENGRPRPLHVDQALRVIDFSTAMAIRPTKVQTRLVGLGWAQEERLVHNAYFDVRRLTVASAGRLSLPGPAPQVLLPLDADLRLDGWGPTGMIVPRGACALVPASLNPLLLPVKDSSGPVTVLWAQPNAF